MRLKILTPFEPISKEVTKHILVDSKTNKMKAVKKYTSFQDLKSGEKSSEGNKVSLEKHNAFEKVIKAIRSIRTDKNAVQQSK